MPSKVELEQAFGEIENVPVLSLYLGSICSFTIFFKHYEGLANWPDQQQLVKHYDEGMAEQNAQYSAAAALVYKVVWVLTVLDLLIQCSDPRRLQMTKKVRFQATYLLIVSVGMFAAHLLSDPAWHARLHSPIFHQELYVVRWAEWSTLAGVMTFAADAMHVPSSSDKGLLYNSMKWSIFHAVMQILSCWFGVISTVCYTYTCYGITMGLSYVLFFVVFWRLYIKRQGYLYALDQEKMAAETDDLLLKHIKEIETHRAFLAYLLMISVSFSWTVLVVIFIIGTLDIISRTNEFFMIAVFDVVLKIIYGQILIQLRQSTLVPQLELQNEIVSHRDKQNAIELVLKYICHEVRVPLNSISLGLANIEQILTPQDQDQRKTIDTLYKCIKVMSDMLNDSLAMQKADAGMCEVHPELVELSSFVSSLVKSVSYAASKKGCNIIIHLSSNTPKKVMFDRRHVATILSNYLSNAVKFCYAGTLITVHVNVENRYILGAPHKGSPTASTRILKFVVQDFGQGVAKDLQPSLFRPFMSIRTHQMGMGHGAGLGLALARNLAMAHGGKAGFESVPAVGSKFFLQIPLVLEDGTAVATEAEQQSEPGWTARWLSPLLSIKSSAPSSPAAPSAAADSSPVLAAARDVSILQPLPATPANPTFALPASSSASLSASSSSFKYISDSASTNTSTAIPSRTSSSNTLPSSSSSISSTSSSSMSVPLHDSVYLPSVLSVVQDGFAPVPVSPALAVTPRVATRASSAPHMPQSSKDSRSAKDKHAPLSGAHDEPLWRRQTGKKRPAPSEQPSSPVLKQARLTELAAENESDKAQRNRQGTAEEADRDRPTGQDFKGERVLVVDDGWNHGEFTRRILHQRMGVRVDIAKSGPDSLRKVHEALQEGDEYSMVLLDNFMPGMSGTQVADIIRQNPRLANLAIAGVSTFSDAKTNFASVGVDQVLQKPVTAEELESLVHKLRSIRNIQILKNKHGVLPRSEGETEKPSEDAALSKQDTHKLPGPAPKVPHKRQRVE